MNKKDSKFVLLLTILGLSLLATPMFGQTKTVYRTGEDGVKRGYTYKEISKATEPCEPLVCEWWSKLRQTGNELQRKGGEKLKREFALLFLEGLEKSYRVPIKDQKPKNLLSKPFDSISIMETLRRLNAKGSLSVEYRFDGSVGEVKVVSSITTTIDSQLIETVRQSIFLPAIKDGAFVTEWGKVEFKYFKGSGRP